MGELLVIRGETDGTSTSGTFSLDSDVFHSPVQHLRIPIGMKVKVWWVKLSGEGETLAVVQYTNDVTAPTPTWRSVSTLKLAAKGEVAIEKRRPLILRSTTGREALRVTWIQPTASKAYVELGVEVSEVDE